MSTTAVGPALVVNGPLPVAPPYALLSIPGVRVGDGDDRWMSGVSVYGYPVDTPSTWEPCSTGTFRTKAEGGDQPVPRFDPFAAYEPITCSAIGMGDWREFAERAEIVLDATQSFPVEHAISQGVAGSTNPFFGDGNLVALGGGAVTPEVGLSYLEQAIGETGRMGMIHAPPAVVAAWGFGAGLRIGSLNNPPSGVLRSPNGNPIAAGGGYIGADPVSEASPAAGQSWVFATGPVQVYIGETELSGDDINGTLDTSNNDVTFRAERYAVATWDTALQVGVLVDWTP